MEPESTFTVLGQSSEDREVVDIDVFKCCMIDGKYLGDVMTHNPNLPGDGPWYVRIVKKGVALEFGTGTREKALEILTTLCREYDVDYQIDIEPESD